MISTMNIASILLVVIASLPITNGFTIPSRPLPTAAPSNTLLHFSNGETDFVASTIELETSEAPAAETTFFPPPKQRQAIPLTQEIDLHGLEELAPLERQMLRMEGLDPYVLVSTLCATSSYGTLSGVTLFQNGHIDPISALLMASSTVSAACGIYATAVFSMSILYGKTALGLDMEESYYKFMENTRSQRVRGCKAFAMSLGAFVTDIFLLGIDKLPEPVQGPAGIAAGALMVFGCTEFAAIMKSASPMFMDMVAGNASKDSRN